MTHILEVCKECTYSAEKNVIIDLIHPDTGRSVYKGETLEETRKRYPDAERMNFDAAIDKKEACDREKLCKPPKQITKAEFWEALECLPPEDWKTYAGVESFKMCERYTGDLTSIYAHDHNTNTYWTFMDSYRLKASVIAERIKGGQK